MFGKEKKTDVHFFHNKTSLYHLNGHNSLSIGPIKNLNFGQQLPYIHANKR